MTLGGATAPTFDAIRRDFGYSEADDARAAADLARKLSAPPYGVDAVWQRAREALRGRTAWVLGAADRAREDARRAPADALLLAADGAAAAALEAARRPLAIVTDLDGLPEKEVEAARDGALVFVHAHGDNGPALRTWLERFPPERVAGTCQVDPVPPLVNPGGFTDGDRAVHLALYLGAREVRVVGFDFDAPGRYSGVHDPATKLRKLAWARRILERLIADGAPVRLG